MKRQGLARKLAQETRLSTAKAQDQVDGMVHRILKSLRSGRSVKLAGVGKLMARGK